MPLNTEQLRLYEELSSAVGLNPYEAAELQELQNLVDQARGEEVNQMFQGFENSTDTHLQDIATARAFLLRALGR